MGCFSSSTNSKCIVHQGPLNQDNNQLSSPLNKSGIKIAASSFISKRNAKLRDHYSMGAKLGSGAFGFVRVATHKLTGQRRAVKTIEKETIVKDSAEQAKFFAEVDVLRATDHPNIVRLYEFYEDEKYFHLVTEYIEGGELFDYIIKSKMLSEPIAAHFMRQLLSAVAYCHANNIVHRDLKPENLLLDAESASATLKVIDFGTSTIHKSTDPMTKRYGTAYYIAPEVLQKDYTEKCDIWSCGVILYILLSGKPPFYGRQDKEILKRVHRGDYSLKGQVWDSISSAAKRLIARMLDYNPKTRISASEALQDEWVCKTASASPSPSLAALENLKAFQAEQTLQHGVLTFIASQLLCREEARQLAETFKNLDKNGDGKLSKEELLEAYSQKMDFDTALEEVENIMKKVDVNGSGFIDYTEFIMASTEKEVLLSKQNLDAAFKAFDIDKNGKISASELKELFGGMEGNNSEALWAELIKDVDSNGDGEIDISEFREMMYKLAVA